MTSWRQDEGDANAAVGLADVKKRCQDFAEPFRSANLWVPDGTAVHANRVSFWETVAWDNRDGRVSLAGDAAHPMTFRTWLDSLGARSLACLLTTSLP